MLAKLTFSLPWIALGLTGFLIAQDTLSFWFAEPPAPWAIGASFLLLVSSYLGVFFLWRRGQANPRLARVWENSALALVLLISAAWRAKMPVVPFAWPDSWFYISMSFDWEIFHQLWPSLREFGYQAFVWVVMALFESPTVLVVIQHALGVASAGLLFIAVRNLAHVLPSRPWVRAVTGLVALGTAAAWALSTISCFYEQYLMPEAIYPFLSAAALALATAALRSRSENPVSGLRAGSLAAGAAFLMLLMYAAIPRWGFGVLLGPIVLYAAMKGSSLSLARRASLWLAPFLAFAILIVIPDSVLHHRRDPQGNTFVQMHLLCIQARIVREELTREAALPQPRYPRALLLRLVADIDREIQRYDAVGHPNGPSPSLGLDPDQLMYQNSVMADLGRAYHDSPPKIRAFADYFYEQAWRHQPLRMLRKIVDQLILVFAHPASLFDVGGFRFTSTDDLPGSRQRMVEALSGADSHQAGGWTAMPGLHTRYEHDSALFGPPLVVKLWHQMAAEAYLPLLAACLLWVGWSAAWPGPVAAWAAWRAIAPAALLGFAGNLLSCLTIAVIHTLDPGRYRDTQMVFSLYAVSGGFVALIVVLDACMITRRQRPA
jgi:hypothetical protein